MTDGAIKVVRVGHTASSDAKKTQKAKSVLKGKSSSGRVYHKTPKFGILKGGKTARKTPRFEAVKDPAKAPPLKKSSKLRILTTKGEKTRRAHVVEKAKKTPIHKIRETLRRHGIPVKSDNEKIAREIYADAQEAGMINDG